MTTTLKLANDLFEGVRDGSKKCTIRNGQRQIDLGLLKFESVDLIDDEDYDFQCVWVWKVLWKKADELSKAELRNDGFRDLKQFLKEMKRFYPDIEANSHVTYIEWD